jgi:hypothetical protein
MNWLARGNRRQSPTRRPASVRPAGSRPGRRSSGPPARPRAAGPTSRQGRLDRVQLGVAGLPHNPVVRGAASKGGLIELLGQQPALVRVGPGGGPAAPHAALAQQELAQPVPSAGAVSDHVGAGAAQIPHRSAATVGMRTATSSPARCRRASRRQSPLSVSGLVSGRFWGSATARSPGSRHPCAQAAGRAPSRSGRPPRRLAAHGDCPGGQRAYAPMARHGGSGRPRGPAGPAPGSPPRSCRAGRPDQDGSGQGNGSSSTWRVTAVRRVVSHSRSHQTGGSDRTATNDKDLAVDARLKAFGNRGRPRRRGVEI